MTWITLGLLSALGLGLYDVSKKASVHQNSALLTLWVTTTIGAVICSFLLLARTVAPESCHVLVSGHSLSWLDHAKIALKAVIVSSSWIFAYMSLKRLPISMVSPIRASGPLWTLFGAMAIYGEEPSFWQGVGFSLTLLSYFAMSCIGKKEGVYFLKNPWVGCVLIGTLIGACSGLYDKYLIHSQGLHPVDVQLWFTLDMCIIQGVFVAVVRSLSAEKSPFTWRWSMPCVAVFLLLADAAYFKAIQDDDVQIGLLSAIRRGSLLVSFVLSCVFLTEKNIRQKCLPILGVLMGIVLISTSGAE